MSRAEVEKAAAALGGTVHWPTESAKVMIARQCARDAYYAHSMPTCAESAMKLRDPAVDAVLLYQQRVERGEA